MSTQMKWSVLPVALLMIGTLAMAQSQTAAPGSASSANSTSGATSDPTAGQPRENQQGRIANGVQSGRLAADETSNLDSEDGAIYGVATADRSADGGRQLLIATRGVNNAINDLSSAFGNKDSNAIKQLWPSIPEKPFAALEKSFSYFKSASRNFRPETIDVHGDTAIVVGTYSGSFVNGARTIPSSGSFHATLKMVGMRWFVVALVCN
jgi:hypothetical protein